MRTPDEDQRLVDLCNNMIEQGEYKRAETFAQILHQDKSSKSLSLLIKAMGLNNKSEDAILLADQFLSTRPDVVHSDRADILIEKSRLLAEKQQYAPALSALRSAKSFMSLDAGNEADNTSIVNGAVSKKSHINYKMGSLLIQMGQLEEANYIFNESYSIPLDGRTDASSDVLNCLFDRSPTHIVEPEIKPFINNPVNTNVDCIHLVSGSLESCSLFSEMLAKQIHNLNFGNTHLVVAGVIAGKDDPGRSERAWQFLAERLDKLNVSLTFLRYSYDLEDLSETQRKTLHEIAKFLVAPDFLEKFKCPVVVSSFDIFPLHASSLLINTNKDIALQHKSDAALDILSLVPSDLAVFTPSSAGHDYALKLKSYYNEALSLPSKLKQGLSEAGLAIVRFSSPELNVQSLPESLIGTQSSIDCSALYAKNAKFIARSAEENQAAFASRLSQAAEQFTPPALARALGTNGDSQFALKLLEHFVNESPDMPNIKVFEIKQLRALIHAHSGDLDMSHQCLVEAQDVLPEGEIFNRARELSLYQLGSVKAALGKIAEAQEIFDTNIQIDCDNGWKTRTEIINLLIERGAPEKVNLQTLYSKSADDVGTFTYFVAADKKYCKTFAPALIDNIRKMRATNLHLHIHGIFSEETPYLEEASNWNFLKELIERADIKATLTIGALNLDGLTQNQKKAVYSAERFRLLPELLEMNSGAVIVADIDQIPLRNPEPLLSNEFDLQLLYFPKSVLNFLSAVSATLSIFYPSPGGKNAATLLASYFNQAYLDSKKLDWHVDQAALATVNYTAFDCKIGRLSRNLVEDSSKNIDLHEAFANGAYFWSITSSIDSNAKSYSRLLNQSYRLNEI